MHSAMGRVTGLWRYPVKSTRGEASAAFRLEDRGVAGDRRWAVRGADGRLGSGKTTPSRFRRMPGLLSLESFLDEAGAGKIRFGDGEVLSVSAPEAARRVSELVGEEVTIVEESTTPHLDDAPLHVLTGASLAWLAARRPDEVIDERRFRPNVLVDGDGTGRVEDGWVGCELSLGEVVVRIDKRTQRCAMPALAQGDLDVAPGLLRELHVAADDCLGVYAQVCRPGIVRVGDLVQRL